MNYLADDLVADVLRRLPVSSVARFGCVCKSWYNLIRSPNFIWSHFQNTQPQQQQQHVVHKGSFHKSDSLTLLFETGDYFDPQQLQLPNGFCFRVAGSCNGILCFFRYDAKRIQFMLFNPSIKRSFWLPQPRRSNPQFGLVLVGFGFDADSNDYKILKLDWSSTEIHSLNSNCWRDISAPKFSCTLNLYGAFVKGALHWVVEMNGENVVMAFDVKAETFQQFSLPSRFACRQQHLSFKNVVEYGGISIAVTLQSHASLHQIDVVVMEEYGVTDSWAHLATVGKDLWGYCDVLGFRDKDQLFIINNSRHLTAYKLGQGAVNDLMTLSEVFSVHKYVPSLFLLDKDNDGRARF